MASILLAGLVLIATLAQGQSGRLFPHRRDEEVPGLFTRDAGGCDTVKACYGREYGDYVKIVGGFEIAKVYGKLGSWCAPKPDCWDDRCDNDMARKAIAMDVRIVQWICDNKEGFKDTTCYQDPFTPNMQACLKAMKDDTSSDLGPRGDRFEKCVWSSVDSLPGCSRNSTFGDLFTYIRAEQRALYKY